MRSVRPGDPWSIGALVCLAGGGVLLLIAWYDISGTAQLYQQMPYLVSAGFTGLALIIIGSALLVAGRNDRVERRLTQLLDAITEAAGEAPDADIPEAPADAAALAPESESDPLLSVAGILLTVPEGTTYHRPGCLLLREKDPHPADPGLIASGALTPCPVCAPERPSDEP
jgi:hypothetical protein